MQRNTTEWGDPVLKTIKQTAELSMANKRPRWAPQHVFGQVRARDRMGEEPDWGRERKPGVSYNEQWMWASKQSCLMEFIPGKVSVLPRTGVCVCSCWAPGQEATRTLWPWNELWESVGTPTGRTEFLLYFNLQARRINMATIGAGIRGPAILDVSQGAWRTLTKAHPHCHHRSQWLVGQWLTSSKPT